MSSILLLFSVISLVVGPAVNSQTFTTITAWSTVTSQVTSTRYSSYAISTTTVTGQLVTMITFPVKQFMVGGMAPGQKSSGVQYYYDGSMGERLQGKWESDYPINFYIKPLGLISEPEGGYLTVQGGMSYSFDWAFPRSGTVAFVFENNEMLSDSSKARIVTFAVYKVDVQSTTSLVYSTTGTVIVYPVTQTFSSVFISQVSESGNNLLSGGLLTVVIVVLVFLVIRSRRRSVRGAGIVPCG